MLPGARYTVVTSVGLISYFLDTTGVYIQDFYLFLIWVGDGYLRMFLRIWNFYLSNQMINSWSSFVTEMNKDLKGVSYLVNS